MEALVSRFLHDCDPRAGIIVALSGGIDSMVLTHLLSRWSNSNSVPVRVIHVDHQLVATSTQWSSKVMQWCAAIDLPCQVLTVDVEKQGGLSLEAAARDARYAAIQKQMNDGDIVLTAHNANDQAETMLLNLMRGSGIRGLGAMRAQRPFGKGHLARPLLTETRAKIEAWARANNLDWIDDPDNENQSRDRNFLRHSVLPQLTERWPRAVDSMVRSADWAQQATHALDESTATLVESTRDGTVELDTLTALPEAQRGWLIRNMARRLALAPPPLTAVLRILNEMVNAKVDANPKITWKGGEARRYRGSIYLMAPLSTSPQEASLTWRTATPLDLPGEHGRLELLGEGPILDLTVSWASGGERITLPRRPTRTLKNVFQERGVPPWVRRRTPLIFHQDVLWSVGVEVQSEACLAWMQTHRMTLHWTGSPRHCL